LLNLLKNFFHSSSNYFELVKSAFGIFAVTSCGQTYAFDSNLWFSCTLNKKLQIFAAILTCISKNRRSDVKTKGNLTLCVCTLGVHGIININGYKL